MRPVMNVLQRPLVYRSAIAFYVIIMLGLIGTSVAIGNRDVRSALYLTGSPTWNTHQPQALRALYFDASTGARLAPDHFELQWNHPHAQPLATAEAGPGHYLHVQLPAYDRLAPDSNAPTRELCALARRESIPELRDCWTIELREPPNTPAESLQQAIGPPTSRDSKQSDRLPPLTDNAPTSQLDLQIGPSDGELVRGLPDALGLRVFERESGQPVRAHIGIELERGLTQTPLTTELTTDALGLAHLSVNALTELTLKITLRRPGSDDTDVPANFTLRLPTVAAQFAISLPQPFVTAGEPVEGAIHTILVDSPFMADLFEGSSMIAADAFGASGGSGGFTLPTPEADAVGPLARVQIYQSFFGAGDAWDIAHLLILDDNSAETLRETTALLLDHLHHAHPEEHWDVYRELLAAPHSPMADTPNRLGPLITFALSRLPRDFQSPQALLNTREDDRRELEAWKDALQRDLYRMMIVVFLVGLLIVAYFVLLGVRRLRHERALLAEIDLELDTPIGDTSDARLEDLVTAFQAFIVFATIALFGLGIILIVSYL